MGPLAQNAAGTLALSPYVGRATVWVQSTQTSFVVRLRGLDQDLTTIVTRTLFAQPAGQEFSQTDVWVPPWCNDIGVTNLNAVAATFTIQVTAQVWAGH